MNLVYTVRPMAEKVFHPYCPGRVSYDVVGAGAVVTIRDYQSGRVVQQFPRVASEAAGHRLAQRFIALRKQASKGNE